MRSLFFMMLLVSTTVYAEELDGSSLAGIKSFVVKNFGLDKAGIADIPEGTSVTLVGDLKQIEESFAGKLIDQKCKLVFKGDDGGLKITFNLMFNKCRNYQQKVCESEYGAYFYPTGTTGSGKSWADGPINYNSAETTFGNRLFSKKPYIQSKIRTVSRTMMGNFTYTSKDNFTVSSTGDTGLEVEYSGDRRFNIVCTNLKLEQ
jgi:hypothetical protein